MTVIHANDLSWDAPPAFAYTDLGNAEHFAHHLGDRLRFDHRRKQWLVWRAPTWTLDDSGEVMRLAAADVRLRQSEATALSAGKAKGDAMTWALKSEHRDRLRSILMLAQHLEPIATPGNAWDSDPLLFACANGVVDLRTGTLRDGRPDDMLTMRGGVDFDPAARAPRFERFLAEIFDGDQGRVEWLQRAFGYSLTGVTSEQVFFLLHGSGANGKGTLTRIAQRVLGTYAWNLPFASFEGRSSGIPNDLAALAGRRFVTASEANTSSDLNEARIKALTGEDDITARFLHGEFFAFRPAAKFWLSTNHRPSVSDLSTGFWRRLREIPFDRTFAIDRTLDVTLAAEAPGIFAWAVRGCLRWQAEGLGNLPAAITDAVAEYRQESHVLADFLATRCVVVSGVSAKASTLYGEYRDWADATSLPPSARLNQTRFGAAMRERGFSKVKGSGGITYHGVGLRVSTEVAA